jgi:branched-chain amino acid transport system ATP-binding protein
MTGQNKLGPSLAPASLLTLGEVTAGYGRTTVLRGIDLDVPTGSVVALLGPNGAGKTTLLRVAAGLLPASAGQVTLEDRDVTRCKPFQRARSGICLIPEGRGIFPNLSVQHNLRIQVPPWRQDHSYEAALDAFPALKGRLRQMAGSLSGGQQQMLALSRCFLADPKVVLLDEVSMGLAPRVIEEIFQALRQLTQRGVSLLIVEQYVSRALHLANRVYLLNRGTVTFSGDPAELDEAELMRQYVGAAAAGPGSTGQNEGSSEHG